MDFAVLFSSWASIGTSFSATILGFLLAGFSVFFAVLKPETAKRLRLIIRPNENMDELKLMFVNFVGVFALYAAFLFWCVAYLVAGGRGGPFDMIGQSLSAAINPSVPTLITHGTFVVWGLWFLILVLQLKSFIYNLYQTLLLALADGIS